MQLLAIILFYYVFILGALLLTWWAVRLAIQAIREAQAQKRQGKEEKENNHA